MEPMRTKTLKNQIPLESAEQKALVKWLSYHPIVRNCFCKIDNEGKRTKLQGHQAKLMGLLPGVSDLFLFYPNKGFYGLWLEIKRCKKYANSEKLTKTWIAQEEFQRKAKELGYAAEFCFGWEHGKKIIEDYLS